MAAPPGPWTAWRPGIERGGEGREQVVDALGRAGGRRIQGAVPQGLDQGSVLQRHRSRLLGMGDDQAAMHDERGVELHAAQVRGLVHRGQQLADGEAVVAVRRIGLLRTARGHGVHQHLALEGVAALAVGPAVFQHQVLPFLEDGRRAVPVKGVLEDDEVVFGEQLLLALDVDEEVGIGLVQIVEGDAGQVPDFADEAHVDPAFLQGGMGEKDEDGLHGMAVKLGFHWAISPVPGTVSIAVTGDFADGSSGAPPSGNPDPGGCRSGWC